MEVACGAETFSMPVPSCRPGVLVLPWWLSEAGQEETAGCAEFGLEAPEEGDWPWVGVALGPHVGGHAGVPGPGWSRSRPDPVGRQPLLPMLAASLGSLEACGESRHCPAPPPGPADPRQEHGITFRGGCQDPSPVHARQGADDLDEGEAGCREAQEQRLWRVRVQRPFQPEAVSVCPRGPAPPAALAGHAAAGREARGPARGPRRGRLPRAGQQGGGEASLPVPGGSHSSRK